MWDTEYKDFKKDDPLIKHQVNSGKGITGCEMHERNGWGETCQRTRLKGKKGLLLSFFETILKILNPNKIK